MAGLEGDPQAMPMGMLLAEVKPFEGSAL